MTTKHKPAGFLGDHPELAPENAAYIAHAANAYPRLVEALREQLQAYEGDFGPQHISTRHRALLRELGEL